MGDEEVARGSLRDYEWNCRAAKVPREASGLFQILMTLTQSASSTE